MTKATDKPVRRLVDGASLGPLVVEITARTLTIRPPRVRAETARIELPWGLLYQSAFIRHGFTPKKAR